MTTKKVWLPDRHTYSPTQDKVIPKCRYALKATRQITTEKTKLSCESKMYAPLTHINNVLQQPTSIVQGSHLKRKKLLITYRFVQLGVTTCSLLNGFINLPYSSSNWSSPNGFIRLISADVWHIIMASQQHNTHTGTLYIYSFPYCTCTYFSIPIF